MSSYSGLRKAVSDVGPEGIEDDVMEGAVVAVVASSLGRLLTELDHLRAQVLQLQTRGTAYELELRATRRARSTLNGQVEGFMRAFDQPIRDTPGLPTGTRDGAGEVSIGPDAWIRLRAELIAEEAFEFVEAIYDLGHANGTVLAESWEATKTALRNAPLRSNLHAQLPHVADALADLAYVVEGAWLTYGIDPQPVLDEVHHTNMLKVGGPIDPVTKKRLKPAGWESPRVDEVLRRLGWTG